MRKISTSLLLALCLALLAGCPASSPPATGSARFAIALPLAPSDISRVSVLASGDDFSSVSAELVLSQGVWSGQLGHLPAGDNRFFLAQAFDSAGALLF